MFSVVYFILFLIIEYKNSKAYKIASRIPLIQNTLGSVCDIDILNNIGVYNINFTKRNRFEKNPETNYDIYDLEYKRNIESKKVISIAPAGLNGFYTLGTSTYIKENYNLDNYIFSGASAGSWIGLYMSYLGDNNFKIPLKILELDFSNISSIIELQMFLKQYFLTKFNDQDFNLNKLFIGVTGIHNLQPVTNIYSNFDSLKDALDCCIASSHIPFFSGGLLNRYDNRISFDGGFSTNPYVKFSTPILHINVNMWKKKNGYLFPNNIEKETKKYITAIEGIKMSKIKNANELFYNGYDDAMKNKDILDSLLI